MIINIILIKSKVLLNYYSSMYLIALDYKNHSKYNFLLFLSLSIVVFSFYFLLKNSAYITITPIPIVVIEEKIISISMVTPEPVVKKRVEKIKKKIVKRVVKKKIVTKTIKKVIPIKKEIVKVVEPKVEQVIQKRVVQKKVTPKPVVLTFDAKMKASFIAGLYEALDEKKHYPKMAKRRKLEGVVTVSFTICKDGTIKNIFLNKSCGHKILDIAALKVIKSIDFYKAIPDAVSLTALNLNIPIKYSRG